MQLIRTATIAALAVALLASPVVQASIPTQSGAEVLLEKRSPLIGKLALAGGAAWLTSKFMKRKEKKENKARSAAESESQTPQYNIPEAE
ncbi:hypothetical protein IWQ60_004015 [Tieghemiomyces parasiticus]|uniref:Uncharacterized protein n=1 Tax=Tieghemiomyces parasiticus TaxID=78921 RepID=A0A9W8A919_9FUNG|nr:hypothetical protein IWQ60_004015 [Tieghemiomyces parasiticus]